MSFDRLGQLVAALQTGASQVQAVAGVVAHDDARCRHSHTTESRQCQTALDVRVITAIYIAISRSHRLLPCGRPWRM